MDLTSPRVIKDICERFDFGFSKGLGQNFLLDGNVLDKIADAAEIEDGVLEVGPGFGVLTKRLAETGKKVVSVEVDKRLIPILDFTLAEFDNVKIIEQDILKTDVAALIKQEFGDKKISVAANLPYYITTPVIMKLIEECCGFGYITVMVQKEVARRLCAKPESADYGSITAEIGLYGGAVKLFDVPAGCFNPRPKVDSAVVRIKLEQPEKYPKADARNASILIKAAFGQRRKTLVNALSGLAGKIKTTDKNELAEIISQTLGVPGDVRGEKLTADQFVTLARALF